MTDKQFVKTLYPYLVVKGESGYYYLDSKPPYLYQNMQFKKIKPLWPLLKQKYLINYCYYFQTNLVYLKLIKVIDPFNTPIKELCAIPYTAKTTITLRAEINSHIARFYKLSQKNYEKLLAVETAKCQAIQPYDFRWHMGIQALTKKQAIDFINCALNYFT
jgi:hypothetical protein